ncbi:MAG: phospholipase D-like domain-containing protein [Puniceicoccales bacterium]|nr:phospholipase D-like domain-containing protein [Puniceicoccales bacterium]
MYAQLLKSLEEFILPNWQSAVGAVVALVAGITMLRQRRRQSNIFAWIFFILVFPLIGTFAFLTFGGRKHRRIAETKRDINRLAGILSEDDSDGNDGDDTPAPRSAAPPAPLGGNSVKLLDDPDGTAMWHALCAEIAAARRTIHITTYLLGHGEVGRAVIRLLAARAREGVHVRLLADAVGSLSMRWGLCRPLIEAGGQVRRFMPVFPFGPLSRRGSANLRNHRKIAVFDGCRAIIGGQNLSTDYTGPTRNPKRFRDFSVLIQGPAVAGLTRIFLSDWCFASGESPELYKEQLRYDPPPAGEVRVEIVSGGPDVPGDPLWEHFVTQIQEARRKITIITPYLVPDEVLFRVLLAKVRAGRKVRLILPKRSDHPFLDLARRPYLRTLHKAGAEIMLYEKSMLHGKLFLIDSSTAVVGSANLDMRSLFVNFEAAAFIYSPSAVRPFRKLVHELQKDCVSYAASPLVRLDWKNRILESLAHLIGPLL